jgi:outer membrane protein assembly factor BamD (BamD/ComL family)
MRTFLPALLLLLAAASAHAEFPKLNIADPSQLAGSRSAEAARPVVGVPLVQAEALFKEGRFADSLAKVREAEKAAPDLSPYELYIINRTKAAVAMSAGQTELAFTATEAAIATNKLTGAAQAELIESLVHAAYGAKDYARAARWAERYAQEGGSKPDIAPLRVQALYLAGDYAAAAAALQAQVKADDAAGRSTSERELQVLASSQQKLRDDAGFVSTLERLATRYPKPAYWSNLLARVDSRTLGDRLVLDLFRLLRATGNATRTEDLVSLATLALHAGFAGEAAAVLDDAAAKGLLGGPDAAKHQALRDKARKQAAEDAAAGQRDEAMAQAAKDGNGLAMLGQIAAAEGRHEAGIALMQRALARGGLRRPDEVKLRLGEAQALAGQGAAARQTLAGVSAPDAAKLARLWALYASRVPPTAPATAAAAASAR